ncbi:MAG: hypothetical protein WCP01_01755 [Methylococcaceae bacterium]
MENLPITQNDEIKNEEVKKFELAQRKSLALIQSGLCPAHFNDVGKVLIAYELAQIYGMHPLQLMQSLFIIHGKPAFDSKFYIAQIVSRYGQIHYEMTGTGDDAACYVWAIDATTGEQLKGSEVSIAMSKKEGWYSKAGSKWPTMPDLMLRYRAAAFFARCYLPDLILGLQSVDEIRDIEIDPETGQVQSVKTRGVRGLKQRLAGGDDEK